MKDRKNRMFAVVVEPKYEGNVGSIARSASNFDLDGMILVNPPELGDEAIAFSMHGRKMLEGAEKFNSFRDVYEKLDYIVGTSGISGSGEKCHARKPITPVELTDWLRRIEGDIGLVFGREDFGLYTEELRLCDTLVTIPANPRYPILNISHAAAIIFYEIFSSGWRDSRRNPRSMNGKEKRVLMDQYERLMDVLNVPEYRKPISMVNFRRMIARSAPNVREFYSLMGTLSRAMDRTEK
jgi:tRNA/rRNA methyltransferase